MPDVVLNTDGLDNLIRDEPQKVDIWLDGFAESIVTFMKLSMGTSPAGMEYTRGGVTHIASQPGYPPNVDIGALINSLGWEPTGQFERTIYAGTEYALPLEEGTEDIQPRPFVAPAFDDAQKRIERDAQENLGLER